MLSKKEAIDVLTRVAVKLNEEDRKELTALYQIAQTTPMIAMSSKDALEGKDFSTLAWNRVRKFMDALGKKYGFDPVVSAISPKTGMVTKR